MNWSRRRTFYLIIAIIGVGLLGVLAAFIYDSASQPRGVTIRPQDNVEAIIQANPAGTTYVFQPGVYRLMAIEPRDGDQFIGNVGGLFSRGAVTLNGATLLKNFEPGEGYWTATGIGQDGTANSDVCSEGYARCNDRYDLFVDDVPLLHVDSVDKLAAGRYHYDYDADVIYLADDPSGHTVEIATVGGAFFSDAENVVIRDLIIEKYAPPAQHGAIHAPEGKNWAIESTTVRLNHGSGIRIGDGMKIRDSRVILNGQIGISGIGDNVLVEDNEIALNNYAGYLWSWEAGGTKFIRTNNLIVRGNSVHNNHGPGLWTDIENGNTLYEDNTVIYNDGAGIFHEISYDAIIRKNTVKFNGLVFDAWLWGAQILISTSSNVQVYDNEVVVHEEGGNGIGIVQQDRGEGAQGTFWAHNNTVENNTIVHMGRAGVSGAAADYEFDAFFAEGNNTFDSNTYYVAVDPGGYWEWAGDRQFWDDMLADGQEANGSQQVGLPSDAGNVPDNIAAWHSTITS